MLSQALFFFSLALIISNIIIIGFQLFPLELFSAKWQLRAANVLTSSAISALAGLVLLQLAAFVANKNDSIQESWHAIGRWGLLAVLGFPLLIPVQLITIFSSVLSGGYTANPAAFDSTLRSLISCVILTIGFAAATPSWNNPNLSYLMKWQNYFKFRRFNKKPPHLPL